MVENLKAGEPFTAKNVRSIRPDNGLHPRHFSEVLGKMAARNVQRGTPMNWNLAR